jgi:hypothetical protein
MGRILAPLLLLGLLASPVKAKEYLLSASICEVGSSCKRCIETINLSLAVDDKNKTVTASGKTIDNKTVQQRLSNCEIQSTDSWRCGDLRGEVRVTDGKLFYKMSKNSFVVSGITFEVCEK